MSIVNLTVAQGGTAASPASPGITATNSGAGTPADLGTIGCTPTPADAHVGCAVNQSTRTLTLTVNTATLPLLTTGNKYVFTLLVTASNSNSPQTIVIVLTVT
jgi:hypothetical protein